MKRALGPLIAFLLLLGILAIWSWNEGTQNRHGSGQMNWKQSEAEFQRETRPPIESSMQSQLLAAPVSAGQGEQSGQAAAEVSIAEGKPVSPAAPSADTMELAKKRAWDNYTRQSDFGMKAMSAGQPIHLTGQELRSMFVLDEAVDADGLALAVEAGTASLATELQALGEDYQRALDAAVRSQLERPPTRVTRELVSARDKEPDEFLCIRTQADDWHFVYALRRSESPELARLLEQSKILVGKRDRETERVLRELIGEVKRREDDSFPR